MDRFSELVLFFSSYKSAVVAFSGGADSSFLLAAAAKALPNAVCAVTFDLTLGKCSDISAAAAFCKKRKIEHKIIKLNPLEIEQVRENDRKRCYYCKKALFSELIKVADGAPVFDGSNAGDRNEYRPGLAALSELNIISPLAQLNFFKPEIVALSAEQGLESAGRPASPCLATRFPYGTQLTVDLLKKAERLEAYLEERGILRCRCRIHGDTVRVEARREDFAKIAEDSGFVTLAHTLGFSYVTLDIEGFRSGSMDK